MPSLNTYLQHLRKHAFPFSCPYCQKSVTPEEFESHCFTDHRLPNNHCVWCMGHTVWPTDQKNFHHVVKCFQNFLKTPSPVPQPTDFERAPEMMDLTPMCASQEEASVHGLPNTPVWPSELPLPALTFLDRGLNLAVACVQWYMSVHRATHWFHVMVRAPGLSAFLKAMDTGKSRTLPFSCYCDGAPSKHRHLIVVSETRLALKRSPFLRKQTIDSEMQLVNLIGDLSQRESHCPLAGKNATHFNIAVPLPALYRIVLAAQWDGGLLQLLNQDYGTLDPQLLVSASRSFGGLWGIRIRDLPGIALHIVLPVSLRPASRQTAAYVHLLQGQKLYFEEGQAEAGERRHVFFECIGDEIWYPTPYQQKCINMAKPLADRIADLEETLERKAKETEALKKTTNALLEENESVKRKLDACRDALKDMHEKHIQLLERENDILRTELLKRPKTEK